MTTPIHHPRPAPDVPTTYSEEPIHNEETVLGVEPGTLKPRLDLPDEAFGYPYSVHPLYVPDSAEEGTVGTYVTTPADQRELQGAGEVYLGAWPLWKCILALFGVLTGLVVVYLLACWITRGVMTGEWRAG